jgi:hypothetical protein
VCFQNLISFNPNWCSERYLLQVAAVRISIPQPASCNSSAICLYASVIYWVVECGSGKGLKVWRGMLEVEVSGIEPTWARQLERTRRKEAGKTSR